MPYNCISTYLKKCKMFAAKSYYERAKRNQKCYLVMYINFFLLYVLSLRFLHTGKCVLCKNKTTLKIIQYCMYYITPPSIGSHSDMESAYKRNIHSWQLIPSFQRRIFSITNSYILAAYFANPIWRRHNRVICGKGKEMEGTHNISSSPAASLQLYISA